MDRNSYGELEGVQVEVVGGSILAVKARQVALTPKTVTLTPEWKVEAEDIISELTTLRRRVSALESLRDAKEIDGEIYAEILDMQKAGYLDKMKKAEELLASIKAKLGQLTAQVSNLTKYLVNAKLDHKSGSLDESALKIARESIEPSLRPLIAERKDLATAAKTLEAILPTKVSAS
jgi:chromosome segregation ATPase